ncbi:hypothetical protein [Micromonospora tarensis]|uniref:Sigma-70, region 4 n=1 Tax=Micromonospora tarensis TaxID=2806100 RepID=A0ABS1YCJ4_9ACTN|nr:hypothetical protein [Micromonospora tarensis]MBM0275123.1 hypothetical protein [Micromonospora tarensis]
MTTRKALYEALWEERYVPPAARPIQPVPFAQRRAYAADLLRVGGVPRTPAEPSPDDDVLRMTDQYRWSPQQVGSVLGLTTDQVARILARHGRRPALEEGLAA